MEKHHTEPVPDSGHHHSTDRLQLPEAAWWVEIDGKTLSPCTDGRRRLLTLRPSELFPPTEVLQAWRHNDGPEVSGLHTLYLRHASLKQDVSPQQVATAACYGLPLQKQDKFRANRTQLQLHLDSYLPGRELTMGQLVLGLDTG